MILLTQEKLIQQHIANAANVFAAVTGAGFNIGICRRVSFLVTLGAGGVGTGTIIVQASATNNMASPTAVPFKYRVQSTANSSDAYASDYVAATAAGFTTAAGANQLVVIEVDARDLPSGAQFVALNTTQVVAGVVAGGAIALGNDPMFIGTTPPTAFS